MKTAVLEFGHLSSVKETAPEPERWKACLVILFFFENFFFLNL